MGQLSLCTRRCRQAAWQLACSFPPVILKWCNIGPEGSRSELEQPAGCCCIVEKRKAPHAFVPRSNKQEPVLCLSEAVTRVDEGLVCKVLTRYFKFFRIPDLPVLNSLLHSYRLPPLLEKLLCCFTSFCLGTWEWYVFPRNYPVAPALFSVLCIFSWVKQWGGKNASLNIHYNPFIREGPL